jgi:hypothetical protein
MNNSYVPIDSVLYDIALVLDDAHYNEHKFREWLIQGFRKLHVHEVYEKKLRIIRVEEHKAELPSDLKTIIQIGYKETLEASEISELQRIMNLENVKDNPALVYIQDPESLPNQAALATSTQYSSWKPLRKSSTTFLPTVTVDYGLYGDSAEASYLYNAITNCPECEHEYSVDKANCLTTTLRSGYIWVSYMAHAQNDSGVLLIPDDEDLKEALLHYCLYKYWLIKSITKEESAFRERDWHLRRYQLLKAKAAGSLNMPDVDTMENILSQRNRLVPRSDLYYSFFQRLNNKTIDPS